MGSRVWLPVELPVEWAVVDDMRENDTNEKAAEQSSTFGRLLLEHRRAAGLTQERLAAASGLSVRALRDLERGRAQAAQRRSSELLADALSLTGGDRDAFLTAARDGRRRVASPVGPPCAVPQPVTDLRGRDRELAEIRVAADHSPVVAVVGQPGVGKTTLAVSAVHQLRPHFPDGCYAVDLRGVDETPVSARMALDRLLRALGVAAQHVPVSREEQSAMLRMVLDGRRVLILLDNAADEAQVRPLLVTNPGCLTLITCRRALGGLETARWVWLDPLPQAASIELLGVIAGPDRVRAEPAAAAELAALCGNLPLAVRIVGNRLATRPRWPLGYLVEQLRDDRTRLGSLSVGDLQVRSAFDVSYRRLSAEARPVFRRLAAIPGPDFGVELAEVVSGAAGVPGLLDELVDASLLHTASTPGRFQFHDLIRLFAGERLAAEETEADRGAIVDAVLDYLLGTAVSAGRVFFPEVLETGQFASRLEAAQWLEVEGPNWLAALRTAARLGRHRAVLDLAKAMHWYSDGRSQERPWEEIFSHGVTAARALGDRSAEAKLLNFVGWAQRRCNGETEASLLTLRQALAVATEAGDEPEQGWAHIYIAGCLRVLGRLDEALEHARLATSFAHVFSFWIGQCTSRNFLGHVLRDLGQYEEALAVHRSVLVDADAHRDSANLEIQLFLRSVTTSSIARVLVALERWGEAIDLFQSAREYAQGGRFMVEVAECALGEGTAWRQLGAYENARTCLRLALDTSTEVTAHGIRQRALAELDLLPGS
ncbi:ATP-binding protein [Actinokineospora inagensis]|uniref:ATP-binding protein n=1 Tax=Actinokineospora inagensis TaxID=103730 RepID=UPI00040D6449|nr:XRE family transcriptional regulator [Actinokineospora inagensis]